MLSADDCIPWPEGTCRLGPKYRFYRACRAERPVNGIILHKEHDRILGIEADCIETPANIFEKMFLLRFGSSFEKGNLDHYGCLWITIPKERWMQQHVTLMVSHHQAKVVVRIYSACINQAFVQFFINRLADFNGKILGYM